MSFKKRFKELRRERQFSQESIAEVLNISRQAVAKWEAGLATPDIDKLIQISELFQIPIDQLVKAPSACTVKPSTDVKKNYSKEIKFLIEAKRNTYASKDSRKVISSRPSSHDLVYKEGDFKYIDTYLGGEKFIGEEGIWIKEISIWAMNYYGRVLSENYSSDFLKEALRIVPRETPFRGPEIYIKGKFTYTCSVQGDFQWFQGEEKIYYEDKKVYELFFHGGIVV